MIKSDSKDIYNVTKAFYFGCCCFELCFEQLFSNLIIIRNIYWAAKHIRVNSEGSCTTEDWSNQLVCHQMNKLHFKNTFK